MEYKMKNMIHNKVEFLHLKKVLGVRDDWHEPDESGVTVTVRGNHLDNAMGASGDCGEKIVIFKKNGKYVAQANLATIFAWASGYEGYEGLKPKSNAKLFAELNSEISKAIGGK